MTQFTMQYRAHKEMITEPVVVVSFDFDMSNWTKFLKAMGIEDGSLPIRGTPVKIEALQEDAETGI